MPHANDSKFTGSVPDNYDRYLGPLLFEPYAADLASRLPSRAGVRVLEIACGTGIATKRLRRRLAPDATYVATDLNEAMIAYARSQVGDAGIDWRTADAQDLPFPDGSFDVVACQFGYMFLPDLGLGFKEAHRVLAPGGVLLANVWCSMDDNPYAKAMQTVLEREFPDDPPRFLHTPYGCHDAPRLAGLLEAAGFADPRLERVRHDEVSTSAAEFAIGFAKGSPLTHALTERGADLDAMASAFTEALVRVGGERPFRTSLAALVITATR